MCVCERERETDRQTDTQTDTQTHRETETERKRQKETKADSVCGLGGGEEWGGGGEESMCVSDQRDSAPWSSRGPHFESPWETTDTSRRR